MIIKDVITIGSAVRDVYFETDAPTIKWPGTSFGRAIVLPLGGKIFIDKVHFMLGGNAANAAVTFARQGLRTGIFAKVGEDVPGMEIAAGLKKEKVKIKLLGNSEKPTSYSAILLQGGERSIVTYRGASNEFNLHGVKQRDLRSKWWYVSLSGDGYKYFDELVGIAKKLGVKIALNPSDKHLHDPGRRQLLRHIGELQLLIVNGEEASAITGIPFKREKEMFEKLDNLVPGIVAVTYGSKGASVSDGNYIYKTGIFKNKKVVDRLGAGDAFGSGFVAGLIRKKEQFKKGVCRPGNIEYALRLASANSTSVIEQIGGTTGALTRGKFDVSPRFKKFKIQKREVKRSGK